MEDYNDYTDTIIDKFFDENQELDDNKFFDSLESKLKTSQTKLNSELERLTKENLSYSKSIDPKNTYHDKLALVTNKYNIFEKDVEGLNLHYSGKLSYISALSRNLEEFENFKKNIEFALKIFQYLRTLNSSDDIQQVLPDIFKDSNKMLEEGVEVYEALRQIKEVCRFYPIFQKHFDTTIDAKFKETLTNSICEFYDENAFSKLEILMKVTKDINSEFVFEIYVKNVIQNARVSEDSNIGLENVLRNLKEFNYSSMKDFDIKNLKKIMDSFQDAILKIANDQFGKAGKVYIIFPSTKHQNVIQVLLKNLSEKVEDYRKIMIDDEKNKSDDVYVEIIELICPQSSSYIAGMKKILQYSKTDLWNQIEQDTNLFMSKVEAIYMSKESNLLDKYQNDNYYDKVKALHQLLKRFNEYKPAEKEKKLKIEDRIGELELSIIDIIDVTNISISKYIKTTIQRYISILKQKAAKKDLIETFCKNIFDAIRSLLSKICESFVSLLRLRKKNKMPISNVHFHYFSRILPKEGVGKLIYL